MAAKPVVLPDTFTGEASWDEWICHFVNSWDDDQKIKFLKVRLMGLFRGSVLSLRAKRIRYQSKFRCQRKKKMDNWADYAEDLRALAYKALRSCKTKQENAWR